VLPFSISLRTGIPIHSQVVYAVMRAVVTGQMAPGDPFPSVRALSQELGINPNTAHKIVATLTADGLLSVRPGIGTVISENWRQGRAGERGLVEEEVERLVMESRRAGLSLQDLFAAIRRHWAKTIRRTG
jgi:GntR family transcriptional regulator